MDPRLLQHPFHSGHSEETAESSTATGAFTGLVDEFLVFGGPSGFNNQYLSRSLFELDSLAAADRMPNGADMLQAPMAPCRQIPRDIMQPDQCAASLDRPMSVLDLLGSPADGKMTIADRTEKPRCWDHGCNGREFSSKSNLMRHVKEKSGASNKCCCPLCGAIFTRSSARDTHLAKMSCNKIRRYSNGRPRPSRLALLENPQVAAVAAAAVATATATGTAAATTMVQDQVHWQAMETIDWDMGIVGDMSNTGYIHTTFQ
ncbi:hypothetical protein F5Y17DRAFT_175186 [Xylariaceae sp. FL0594]|nr:hypothetical protein F5Y17DRAFT_175186 [Xylariaceae sp. FL0594]